MLVFYLVGVGLSEPHIGMLLTLTLVGDTLVSLYLTTRADRLGRGRVLIVGALLMAAAGIAFASTSSFWLLLVAGTIGVISPSGNEVGPFLSVEQAALTSVITDRTRTEVFAWYTLVGSVATALGALAGGAATRLLQSGDMARADSYRTIVILYGVLGLTLAALFSRLSPAAEPETGGEPPPLRSTFANLSGLGRSKDVVLKALGAVRDRRVRRRLRDPELRGVLVLPALRRRSRHARARSSSGRTSWRGSRRCSRRRWRRASA